MLFLKYLYLFLYLQEFGIECYEKMLLCRIYYFNKIFSYVDFFPKEPECVLQNTTHGKVVQISFKNRRYS